MLRCAPLLALCTVPWGCSGLLCSIVFSSQWVFGCVGHCRTVWQSSPGVWSRCPVKCSEQFAFQASGAITWGDHGGKLWVVIRGTGVSSRSDDGTKILPKWGKITLPNAVFLVLARHYFNLGPEVSGWQSSCPHTNADTKLFHLFIHFKQRNWYSLVLSDMILFIS